MLIRGHSSFDEFAFHLHTNTIGPIITANRLLQTNIPIGTIVFMSSDSGSQGNFREMEDGFAAYAASKAALNMAIRHLAAELKRKDDDTIILAMHPGEVATDMANVQLPWEVQGIITPEESVMKMIEVIKSKGIQHSGTFWTYENKVSRVRTTVMFISAYFISRMFGSPRLWYAQSCIAIKNSPLYLYPILEYISLNPIS
jgi:NAD(P)-dependent dehydrogenase (short-subunit alcohol dehydrogenase family)